MKCLKDFNTVNDGTLLTLCPDPLGHTLAIDTPNYGLHDHMIMLLAVYLAPGLGYERGWWRRGITCVQSGEQRDSRPL